MQTAEAVSAELESLKVWQVWSTLHTVEKIIQSTVKEVVCHDCSEQARASRTGCCKLRARGVPRRQLYRFARAPNETRREIGLLGTKGALTAQRERRDVSQRGFKRSKAQKFKHGGIKRKMCVEDWKARPAAEGRGLPLQIISSTALG